MARTALTQRKPSIWRSGPSWRITSCSIRINSSPRRWRRNWIRRPWTNLNMGTTKLCWTNLILFGSWDLWANLWRSPLIISWKTPTSKKQESSRHCPTYGTSSHWFSQESQLGVWQARVLASHLLKWHWIPFIWQDTEKRMWPLVFLDWGKSWWLQRRNRRLRICRFNFLIRKQRSFKPKGTQSECQD